MEKIPFVIHPRSNESNTVEIYFILLLAKYTPMSHKNGGQKQEWQYPTACVESYFIPDKNIQTYLICLQSCNMQKHQKANFRTAECLCTTMMVESEHNVRFMTRHIMKHAFTSNLHKINANQGKHCCYKLQSTIDAKI